MVKLDARKSGTFKIGGELKINRLGFGAMRVTGPGIWGEPADRAEALRTLKRVPRARHRLHRHGRLATAPTCRSGSSARRCIPTTASSSRPRAGSRGRPPTAGCRRAARLPDRARRAGASSNLGLEQIDLWQLHRIDPKVPRGEQFGAVKQLLDARHHSPCGPEQRVGGRTSRRHRRCSRSPPCRTATISMIARARTCSSTASATASASSRGTRSASGALAKSQLDARRRREALRRDQRPDRARLAAEAQPRDAADPRHVEGQAPGGERRRGPIALSDADFAELDREGSKEYRAA